MRVNTSTSRRIVASVSLLVGLPLVDTGLIGSMQTFGFGLGRDLPDRDGKLRHVPDFALHIQCAWRLVEREAAVVADRDLFYPADVTSELPDHFEWQEQLSRRTALLERFFQERSNSIVVRAIRARSDGALKIKFNDYLELQIFPNSTYPGTEHWRIFRPRSRHEHFVYCSEGFTLDSPP
jgi:hypothetical protein